MLYVSYTSILKKKEKNTQGSAACFLLLLLSQSMGVMVSCLRNPPRPSWALTLTARLHWPPSAKAKFPQHPVVLNSRGA